jgi:hypothetical protein
MRKDGKITLDEVLEEAGLTAKWEARGELRREARGRATGEAHGEKYVWKFAIFPLKQGYTVDQLQGIIPGGFSLPA